MFLIHEDRQTCAAALNKLRNRLSFANPGPVRILEKRQSYIGWFACKPSDNLHVFDDGMVIGKLDFAEPCSSEPLRHEGPLPENLHPLLISTKIKSNGNFLIEPSNITNVFYSEKGVSDSQLLITDANRSLPDPEGVAVLAAIGYLPGNLTLFNRISKIPLLHVYDVERQKTIQTATYPNNPPDDSTMLERLTQIIPRIDESYVGLSGGYDSRFILGTLLRAGIRPHILHLSSREEEIVRNLASKLHLPLRILNDHPPKFSPDLYTIMTDGQIYLYGGHYSWLRDCMPRTALFYTGLFSNLIKNACGTAWKLPYLTSNFLQRLVDKALLSQTSKRLHGFPSFKKKQELAQFIAEKLSFETCYHPFERKKAWSCWFAYMNRGIRWSQVHLADLSFFSYPVFLMSDLQALSHGITTDFWQNFNKDRVRSLNYQLLPGLDVPYADGQSSALRRPVMRAFKKIKYEYLDRALVQTAEARKSRERSKSFQLNYAENPPSDMPEFREYYQRNLPEIVTDPAMGISFKRSAATVYYVLQYLKNH